LRILIRRYRDRILNSLVHLFQQSEAAREGDGRDENLDFQFHFSTTTKKNQTTESVPERRPRLVAVVRLDRLGGGAAPRPVRAGADVAGVAGVVRGARRRPAAGVGGVGGAGGALERRRRPGRRRRHLHLRPFARHVQQNVPARPTLARLGPVHRRVAHLTSRQSHFYLVSPSFT